MLQNGKTKEEALEVLRQRSRDNGRTPMQWDDGPNVGFSDGTPWILPPEHCRTANAAAEIEDSDSILHFYKTVIRMRKETPVLSEGQIAFLCQDQNEVLAYRRFLDDDSLYIFNNLSDKTLSLDEVTWTDACEPVLGNYSSPLTDGGRLLLRPYETVVCRMAPIPSPAQTEA